MRQPWSRWAAMDWGCESCLHLFVAALTFVWPLSNWNPLTVLTLYWKLTWHKDYSSPPVLGRWVNFQRGSWIPLTVELYSLPTMLLTVPVFHRDICSLCAFKEASGKTILLIFSLPHLKRLTLYPSYCSSAQKRFALKNFKSTGLGKLVCKD